MLMPNIVGSLYCNLYKKPWPKPSFNCMKAKLNICFIKCSMYFKGWRLVSITETKLTAAPNLRRRTLVYSVSLTVRKHMNT